MYIDVILNWPTWPAVWPVWNPPAGTNDIATEKVAWSPASDPPSEERGVIGAAELN